MDRQPKNIHGKICISICGEIQLYILSQVKKACKKLVNFENSHFALIPRIYNTFSCLQNIISATKNTPIGQISRNGLFQKKTLIYNYASKTEKKLPKKVMVLKCFLERDTNPLKRNGPK